MSLTCLTKKRISIDVFKQLELRVKDPARNGVETSGSSTSKSWNGPPKLWPLTRKEVGAAPVAKTC